MKINLMKEIYGLIRDNGSCSLCSYENRMQNEEPCSSCRDYCGGFKLPPKTIRIIAFLQEKIDRMLTDEEDVMPEPFIPNSGDTYFYLSLYCAVHREKYFDRETCSLDIMRAKTGNCFRTREELEKLTLGQRKKLWEKFYKLEDKA